MRRLRTLAIAAALTTLAACGPTLWSLQDDCRAGDTNACIVAQQRLAQFNMAMGGLASSAQRSYPTAPTTPTTCTQQGAFLHCY